MRMKKIYPVVVAVLAMSVFGAVGDRPGVLSGNPHSPILVAALTGHNGRIYLLGTDGRIVWEQTGCGNVHCARLYVNIQKTQLA